MMAHNLPPHNVVYQQMCRWININLLFHKCQSYRKYSNPPHNSSKHKLHYYSPPLSNRILPTTNNYSCRILQRLDIQPQH